LRGKSQDGLLLTVRRNREASHRYFGVYVASSSGRDLIGERGIAKSPFK